MFFRCKKEKQARKEFEERLAKIKASKTENACNSARTSNKDDLDNKKCEFFVLLFLL